MRQSLSGVGVLDKAVLVLSALEAGPASLPELVDRTGLPRATAHRLACALEHHGLAVRDGRGRFLLGPRLSVLGRVAAGSNHRTLTEAAGPVLAELRDRTGESSQLYVRAGDSRVCVASLESPHSLRTIVAVGALLPMDRGSAAKVLRGDRRVLELGWAESVEEREQGVASVSAPLRVGGEVIAAVSVSGPLERTSRRPGRRYAGEVVRAAESLRSILESASP